MPLDLRMLRSSRPQARAECPGVPRPAGPSSSNVVLLSLSWRSGEGHRVIGDSNDCDGAWLRWSVAESCLLRPQLQPSAHSRRARPPSMPTNARARRTGSRTANRRGWLLADPALREVAGESMPRRRWPMSIMNHTCSRAQPEQAGARRASLASAPPAPHQFGAVARSSSSPLRSSARSLSHQSENARAGFPLRGGSAKLRSSRSELEKPFQPHASPTTTVASSYQARGIWISSRPRHGACQEARPSRSVTPPADEPEVTQAATVPCGNRRKPGWVRAGTPLREHLNGQRESVRAGGERRRRRRRDRQERDTEFT